VCSQCDKTFKVKERKELFPLKEQYYCSKYCANFRGSGEEWAERRGGELIQYRTICWAYHEKQCVVCGESKIVEVHHYDGVHDNNDPKNLVPLCPTHHQYWHSPHKEDIEEIVHAYVSRRWLKSC
jgi:hypothetical protein